MPKASKKSVTDHNHVLPEESDVPENPEESASSDLEQEVSFHPSLAHPAHPVQQVTPSMCLSYI